jgi:tetratricopeptide (TPR) repeat protein
VNVTLRQRITTAVAVACLVCSTSAAAFLLHRVQTIEMAEVPHDVLLFPSPKLLKKLSLGYDGLLADIYWTRVVQYFGDKHQVHSTEYRLLPGLLDITTELDPQLVPAYQFGAVFLAQRPPQGAGDPRAAVDLVERGIRANPDAWRLYYHLGFIYAIELQDYASAAQAFDKGSQIPGAQPWMKVMAAAMAQHGGHRETARYMWRKIFESSEDEMIKANAVQHLQSMKADDDMRALEHMAANFRDAEGHLPTLEELIAAGWLRGMPIDPAGRPYRLLPDGHAQLQQQSADDLPFTVLGRPENAPTRDYLK